MRPIKWTTVEEQKIIHEWHLIYSNLIAQKLTVDSFSVCSVLCNMSIILLKKIFWGPSGSLMFWFRCITYFSPLKMLLEKPHGAKCCCVIFVFFYGETKGPSDLWAYIIIYYEMWSFMKDKSVSFCQFKKLYHREKNCLYFDFFSLKYLTASQILKK